MLSRVAENLYWMARYLERADNTARFINSVTQMLLDLPRGASFGWDVLLKVAGLDELYAQYHDDERESDIIRFLIQDERNPSSILASIQCARENTRTFREVVPMELWERINGLYLYVRDQAEHATQGRSQRYALLDGVIEHQQAITGLLMGSMSQDLAYQFIKLGRNLERADMTTRILDVNSAVRLPAEASAAQFARERLWVTTLNALSAYLMYRRHVGMDVAGASVLRYLLCDKHFPRSVAHCLGEIEDCLAQLVDYQEPLRLARALWRRLETIDCAVYADTERLHHDMDRIQAELGALHAAISQRYFYRYQPTVVAHTTQDQS
ncbi:alpha-E domain-containing protein [Caldichromatium japonicum]|uniref:Alpha-E domain-containing protein n=1 Tax=Caldichromatium japonicum TaxID=2699430 RepID=A0A6G7VE03_9GAMM|nr:alpha-E domain-containing protein [Caldichromatium japonicum]QIK38140.1 alpha-E domain-containing protein [Caldichromatium japonicum]